MLALRFYTVSSVLRSVGVCVTYSLLVSEIMADLISERCQLLSKEKDMMLGSDIVFSQNEEKANEIIMELKKQEIKRGFNNPESYCFNKHFFQYKDEIKETAIFKVLQRMPKGAVLHAHDTGLLSPDYVVGLTYWPNLYVRFSDHGPEFKFAKHSPNVTSDDWQLMADARSSSGDIAKFDADLRKHFSIIVDNPKEVHSNINGVWSKFAQFFIITTPLMTYKPVWEQYFYDTLKAFKDDNVMYIEIRSVLPELYDLEGNIYDSVATAETYNEILEKFMADYPDFFGAKLIYAPLRCVNKETVAEYIEIARRIKQAVPNFFAGFDLVGQEDLGSPLLEFIPILQEAMKDLDYFFHAGETNWYGTSSDENLADAIVLGTKRIGHAFALIKHPVLLEEVKRRDIAIEVNVISNAVLKLVDDVRNHPLASFVAQGVPVVVSSDDPGIWGAEPLSHDFYVAFVGVLSRHADLKVLKKLALNSLHYSVYSDKDKIVNEFEIRWTRFIDSIIREKW